MRQIKKLLLVLLVLLVVYAGVFTYMWMNSMAQILDTSDGKQVRQVMLRKTRFVDCTLPVWRPAFWFMEHIFGYRRVANGVELSGEYLIFNKP